MSTISFGVTCAELKKLMSSKGEDFNNHLNEKLGGIKHLCGLLRVDPNKGLDGTHYEIEARRKSFGSNIIPCKVSQSFLQLMWIALQDITLIALLLAALFQFVVSLITEYFNLHGEGGSNLMSEMVECLAILIAVVIVVIVTAGNDYQKEKKFRALQDQISKDHTIDVYRNGNIVKVIVQDLVVGDIVVLKYGDSIPADAIVISSHELRIDESSMTGESDLILKNASNPILLAGTYVMEGSGRCVITAVGVNSQTGVIISLLGATKTEPSKAEEAEAKDSEALELESDQAILQQKLGKLTILIGKLGSFMALLTFVVLTTRFVIGELVLGNKPSYSWINPIIGFIMIAITVVVVAVPEGLPLAVTISLAYSVKKMLLDNNLVRHLNACETMGRTSTICSDKTGTLTKNRMSVTQIYVHDYIYRDISCYQPNSEFLNILSVAISVNTAYTSQVLKPVKGNLPVMLGNKTDCALLEFVLTCGIQYDEVRCKYPEDDFVKVFSFNSVRKSMSTVIELPNGSLRIFTKGASENVLQRCTRILNNQCDIVPVRPFNEINSSVIQSMAEAALRTICVAYRDVPANFDLSDEDNVNENFICLAIFGIEDPVRDEVPESIAKCQTAGITIRMVTGDNLITASAIAEKCGIIKKGFNYLALESKDFNNMIRNQSGEVVQEKLDHVWPRLRVLARSSPTDKYVLVKGIINSKLSSNREVVAVTGDGTNDAPALKKADVGFAMGISGTDVAKEACDIIITDDNFVSIVKAVMWGRNVFDNISKFIQFQLTVNIVAVLLTLLGALFFSKSPLRAVQMLWVNLIMDSFASLALATETPTPDLLSRKPYGRDKPLVSKIMLRNILAHSIYQLIVLFLILFFGPALFHIKDGSHTLTSVHYTLVFNTFVFLQLFNEFNTRKIHGESNVFKGVCSNVVFMVIISGTALIQFLLVEFGGSVFGTEKLNGFHWLFCVGIGASCLLWQQIINLVPIKYLPRCFAIGIDVDVDNFHLEEIHSSEVSRKPSKDAKLVFIRSVARVRQEIGVLKVFKENVSPYDVKLRRYSEMKRLRSSSSSYDLRC